MNWIALGELVVRVLSILLNEIQEDRRIEQDREQRKKPEAAEPSALKRINDHSDSEQEPAEEAEQH